MIFVISASEMFSYEPHSEWFKFGSIVTDEELALVRAEGGGHKLPRWSVYAA